MIWVEVLSRQHDVISRHRIADVAEGASIRIGRAYDNDVVIDDAYVAPHHLQLSRDADRFIPRRNLFVSARAMHGVFAHIILVVEIFFFGRWWRDICRVESAVLRPPLDYDGRALLTQRRQFITTQIGQALPGHDRKFRIRQQLLNP